MDLALSVEGSATTNSLNLIFSDLKNEYSLHELRHTVVNTFAAKRMSPLV
jgi:hypothetical protein